MALTPKQKIFADEYLIDLNATRAYKVAYPNVKKDEVAAAAATRLLRNVKVADYVQKRMDERAQRTEITQDWVLEELRKIASVNGSDFAKVVVKEGYPVVELMVTDDLPEEKRAAISAIKETTFFYPLAMILFNVQSVITKWSFWNFITSTSLFL